jgi:outer membrane protein assembly factor BamB
VFKTPTRFELLAAGNPWLMSYDPATGKEWWRAKVCHGEVTPSPVFGGGFIITANEEICALKPDGAGDVTKTHVVWKALDGIPDICSPLVDGKLAYMLTSSGVLTTYDLANTKPEAKPLYEKELEEDFKASPSLAGGRLYFFSEKGNMIVAEAGPQFKLIAKSNLGDEIFACPAFGDGRIYIRARSNLYCIGTAAGK